MAAQRQSLSQERDELSAELPLLDSPTLYQWVGDWPGYLSLILIVLMAFVRRREPEAVSAS